MTTKKKKKGKGGPKKKPHGLLKSRIVLFIENNKIAERGGEEAIKTYIYSQL